MTDNEVSFCALVIGDHFMFNGAEWKIVEMQRTGHCGCTPHYNAIQVNDESQKGLYNCNHMVVKL